MEMETKGGAPPADGFTFLHPAFTLEVPAGFLDAGSPVYLLGPERDGFRANVATLALPMPGVDFEAFFARATEEVGQMRGGRVVSSDETVRDGVRFGRIVYRYRHEGNLLRVKSLFAKRGDTFFRILFTAPDGEYDRLLPLADRILESFRLT